MYAPLDFLFAVMMCLALLVSLRRGNHRIYFVGRTCWLDDDRVRFRDVLQDLEIVKERYAGILIVEFGEFAEDFLAAFVVQLGNYDIHGDDLVATLGGT